MKSLFFFLNEKDDRHFIFYWVSKLSYNQYFQWGFMLFVVQLILTTQFENSFSQKLYQNHSE